MIKRRVMLIALALAALLLLAFAPALQQGEPVTPQAAFTGAVLAFGLMVVKIIAWASPGWNPPEGFFGRLQYWLALVFAVLGPIATVAGFADQLDVFLVESANIITGFVTFVGIVVASTGLYGVARRVFGWLGIELAYTPPEL